MPCYMEVSIERYFVNGTIAAPAVNASLFKAVEIKQYAFTRNRSRLIGGAVSHSFVTLFLPGAIQALHL